jgi:hypothetical protein
MLFSRQPYKIRLVKVKIGSIVTTNDVVEVRLFYSIPIFAFN